MVGVVIVVSVFLDVTALFDSRNRIAEGLIVTVDRTPDISPVKESAVDTVGHRPGSAKRAARSFVGAERIISVRRGVVGETASAAASVFNDRRGDLIIADPAAGQIAVISVKGLAGALVIFVAAEGGPDIPADDDR